MSIPDKVTLTSKHFEQLPKIAKALRGQAEDAEPEPDPTPAETLAKIREASRKVKVCKDRLEQLKFQTKYAREDLLAAETNLSDLIHPKELPLFPEPEDEAGEDDVEDIV